MPAAVPVIELVGQYVTDGRQLFQILAVDTDALICDDVRLPIDYPEIVRVPFTEFSESLAWKVICRDEATSS